MLDASAAAKTSSNLFRLSLIVQLMLRRLKVSEAAANTATSFTPAAFAASKPCHREADSCTQCSQDRYTD